MMYFNLIVLPKITFSLKYLYLLLSLLVVISIQKLKSKNNKESKFYRIILVYGKKILKNTTPVLFSIILIYIITSISNNLKLGPDAIHFSGVTTTVLMVIYLIRKYIDKLKKME